MKNITVNGGDKKIDLDRKIFLKNGAVVFHKCDDKIVNVFMIVSYRYNESFCSGYDTVSYCTLVNLDDGDFLRDERCNRKTTIGRLLGYLLRANDARIVHYSEEKFDRYNVEIYDPDTYKIDITI